MATIGRYQIKHEIGRGGMASVYLAYDPHFGRDVAVKVLPAAFTHDATFRARFKREAKVIAALEHPAIVPVYDYGEHQGQPYLVMRIMAGGSLADRLARGPLSRPEIAHVLSTLAPALDKAHRSGVIHRDLKPANILFDGDGNPAIADFGIAKLAEASATYTSTGIIGTPAYMSPEQVEGERALDGRSDVYALGVILYELLAGKPPYQADTPMSLALMHLRKPVPHVSEVVPGLPKAVDQVVTAALAKDPDQRYATAGALATAFNAALRGAPLPTTVPQSRSGQPSPPGGQTPRPTAQAPGSASRRGRLTWLLLPLGLAAVGVIVTMALLGGKGGTSEVTPTATKTPVLAAVSTIERLAETATSATTEFPQVKTASATPVSFAPASAPTIALTPIVQPTSVLALPLQATHTPTVGHQPTAPPAPPSDMPASMPTKTPTLVPLPAPTPALPAAEPTAPVANFCFSFTGPAATIDVGTNPSSVAAADLHGDGWTDLVVANRSDNTISILRNNGNGRFSGSAVYGVGSHPYGLAVADLDRDGDTDVIAANGDGQDLSVLRNQGDGTFASQVTYPAGIWPHSVAAGDLNRDGFPDLATANYGDIPSNVSVLLNRGDGSLGPPANFTTGQGPDGIAIGDVNSDGNPDLATADFHSGTVSVLINSGNAIFQSPVAYEVAQHPSEVALADLTGDGALDLAVADNGNGNIVLLRNDGNGTFTYFVAYYATPSLYALIASDLDNDGWTDLTAGGGGKAVMLCNGRYGDFSSQQQVALGANPHPGASADLDGDGHLDLALPDYDGNRVYVILNSLN